MSPCMCWQKNRIDLLAVTCNVFPRGIDTLLYESTSKNEAETFVLIMSKTWASNSAYGRCTDVPDHSLQPVASISSHQFSFLPLCSFLVWMWKTVHTASFRKLITNSVGKLIFYCESWEEHKSSGLLTIYTNINIFSTGLHSSKGSGLLKSITVCFEH